MCGRWMSAMAQSCSEKRDTLMAQFFPAPPPASLSDIAEAEYGSQLPYTPFSGEEVEAAIQNLSPFKAPGPSGVPNAALKECSAIVAPVFTNLINRCLQLGHHPAQWKFFTTITLRKPGKPSYLVPKAYRPIALEDTSRLSNLSSPVIWRHWRRSTIFSPPTTSVAALRGPPPTPYSTWCSRLLHNLRKRGVPEPLVLWIADFLKERRTQLKFDDFTSEPLLADCGLPQGSPLSPILYLFYSSDLLELFDPKDRQYLSLGYIIDTAMVVTSPRLCRSWSCAHACRFDIGKFQLVHHTRYEPRYEPLPLVIDGHTITPSESARYLGIIVDRRLRWHEHVDAAIAKGTAAVLAVGRLARPTFGLPHQYARRLFNAVVYPRLEYGLPRLAGLMTTGAFKSTSSVVLDYHADLLPVELRLNQAAHRAAPRLAALPDSHPLFKAVQRCTSQWPRFHRSPLHELFHCFSDLRHVVATVSHAPTPSSIVPGGRGAGGAGHLRVFIRGCTSGSKIGAAAVTVNREGGRVSCRASLGPAALRQAHDGVLAAMTLALCAIMGCPRVTRATILVPNRAAVTAPTSRPDHPLVRLFLARLSTIRRCSRSSLRLRIVWAPPRGDAGGSESLSGPPHAACNTVGNVKARAAVLDFVDATGRFEAYRAPPQ
uniref:Acyl-CoA ligase AFT1-1 ) n=1 Tax=Ganoderma boninense TaxID=34458 RepID=A0A5K1K8G9_9APHY|nr:Acyl-CoA ligase AFT1-1 (EC (AF-toxin biosynthesis protein 1-1) [Ganoderma boninense]